MSFAHFLDSAPVLERNADSITKRVSSAEAIWTLPAPTNIPRSRDLIPDVPVTLILSTGPALPVRIQDILAKSQSQHLVKAVDFLGLCISGQEIFLHKAKADARDPSGKLGAAIFWHEAMHALEGLKPGADGEWRREMPWSFTLQKKLNRFSPIDMDAFIPAVAENKAFREYIGYMRQGLDVQGHVSELFARVGVLMLEHICQKGTLPRTGTQFWTFIEAAAASDNSDAVDMIYALHSFDKKSLVSFWRHFPQMMKRTAHLYGCDMGA